MDKKKIPLEYFEYEGKSYPFKSVYFQNEDANYIISCEKLNKVLLPNGFDYDSDKAKNIDEQIFFFVPDDMINESDEVIEKYVSEAI